jgi:peptidoglycan/xylan/chitin deacetylase (PgdA/CDA1 family)
MRGIVLALLAVWLVATLSPAHADETRRRLRVPILMYHYVSTPPDDADRYRLDLSVTPDQFAAQLRWLRDHGYTAVSLDDVYNALHAGTPLPPRPVVLTFDDGYADAYHHAYRLLRQFGMTGTFFVVTEWIDQNRPGYLTWDQAREMAAAGMSIQSHSRTHPDLSRGCDYDCLVYQILGSVETIEAEIGVRPRFFCYPGGRYNADILTVLEQVGIVAAVTTQGGTLHVSDRPLELARVRVRGTTQLGDFAWMVRDWRG